MRVKGDRSLHWEVKDRTSYKIDIKGEKRLLGLEEFSVQKPITRNYTYEFIFHKLLEFNELISLKYHFVNLKMNDTNQGIYALEEGFSKEFGARHKHHGYYDYKDHRKYFGHDHDGLNEVNMKANIDILKSTNLLVALHSFRSAVNDIYYGREMNFIFKTKHNNEVSSEIGSVFYFPDQGDEKTLPFFYLMITAGF